MAIEESGIPAGARNFDSLPPSAYVSKKVASVLLEKHPVTIYRWLKPGGPLADVPTAKLGAQCVGLNVGGLRVAMARMQNGSGAA